MAGLALALAAWDPLDVASVRLRLLLAAGALIAYAGPGLGPSFRRAMRRNPRQGAAALAFVAVVAGAAAGFAAGTPVRLHAWLVERDEPVPVDAVFVFSGDVDFHRTTFGAEVYRRTGARSFVVSGAGSGGDSGLRMAEAARRAGVPPDAIVVETRAESTRENVAFSEPLLRAKGIRSVAVVTSPYHSRRAAMAARRAWRGIDVVSIPVPPDHPLACPASTRARAEACERAARSEWTKLAGYLLYGWI